MATQVVRFTGPHAWSAEERARLTRTFTCELGEARVRLGVQNGSRILSHVFLDGVRVGSLVTELLPNRELFIWCYQGARSIETVRAVGTLAAEQGVPKLSFFTPHHKAIAREWKRYKPEFEPAPLLNEKRVTFSTEVFINGNQ